MGQHVSRSTHAAAISSKLRQQKFVKYQPDNNERGGFKVEEWGRDVQGGTRVRVWYAGLDREVKPGGKKYHQALRDRLFEMMNSIKGLEKYEVSWGFDEETGDDDTTFFVVSVSAARNLEKPEPEEKADPYALSRPLGNSVETVLQSHKYVPAAVYGMGYAIDLSILEPIHVTVRYVPNEHEDLEAVRHTVQAYYNVLTGFGYNASIVDRGHPELLVATDAQSILEAVNDILKYDAQVAKHAEEQERVDEWEEAEAERSHNLERLAGLLITMEQAQHAVSEITRTFNAGKDEQARRLEAQLYRAVLTSVLAGSDDAVDLAAVALETQALPIAR